MENSNLNIEVESNEEYPIVMTGQELADYCAYLSNRRENFDALSLSITATLQRIGEQVNQFKSKINQE